MQLTAKDSPSVMQGSSPWAAQLICSSMGTSPCQPSKTTLRASASCLAGILLSQTSLWEKPRPSTNSGPVKLSKFWYSMLTIKTQKWANSSISDKILNTCPNRVPSSAFPSTTQLSTSSPLTRALLSYSLTDR